MPKCLTKSDIADRIYEEMGYTRVDSLRLVEDVIESIKQSLENGEEVLLSGFGKFRVKEKRERRGRNPATSESLVLAPRRVVTFKCSGKLRDKVNGKG
ncbi:integration host factor subunit alpha [Thermodesulfobacteriota bacterium]